MPACGAFSYFTLAWDLTDNFKNRNDEYMNFIYLNCADEEINTEKIITVKDATYAVAKRKPGKIQSCRNSATA